MATPYIYPAARPATFYARRKDFKTINGETLHATLSPLTSGTFLKPCKGPRGGRAYKTCYRQLWIVDGALYRAIKTEFAPGEYGYTLAPFSGSAYDRYDTAAPAVTYSAGYPAN